MTSEDCFVASLLAMTPFLANSICFGIYIGYMYFEVKKAEYIKDYQIKIYFENGKKGIVDFIEYLGKNDIFQNFEKIELFKNFKIEYGTLTWENGNLDIAPETLYLKATGEKEISWGKESKLKVC